MRPVGPMRDAIGGASHSPTSATFVGMRRWPVTRYIPEARRTLPPPASRAVSRAFWMAAVQSVLPSPAAPKSAACSSIAPDGVPRATNAPRIRTKRQLRARGILNGLLVRLSRVVLRRLIGASVPAFARTAAASPHPDDLTLIAPALPGPRIVGIGASAGLAARTLSAEVVHFECLHGLLLPVGPNQALLDHGEQCRVVGHERQLDSTSRAAGFVGCKDDLG